uniref:Uncharacterized protein n=1 Tax=Fagus sylvatica TaxID=28930 RepID=A0A2N9EQM2_FAGSY
MEAINSSAGAVVPSHSGFMSIKLDRTNYPLWLAQIVPILKSKNLMGFVTGTNPCPPEFKRNTDGTVTTEVDPRYATWHQQDQMILSWINNSLSPTVLSTVAQFTSSQATWSSLEKRYASQSKNRILQLRHDLLTVKGEGLSISDFVDKINQIADNLALAGKPVDDDELVNIILNNVGPAYEVTVSSAQARDTSISYDDLVALLLNAEMRLKAQQTPSLEASPTAMYTPKATQSNNRGRNSVHHRGSNMRGRGPSGFRRNQNWSQPQSGSVSFGNSGPMPSRPPCQICNRSGHSALDCYQRMNHAYEGRIPTQKLTAMAATASSNIPSTTWISDSGASNHITADLTNLAIHNEYQGKDHVAVGNGAGLTIAHTGSSKFTCGSSTFALKNILHCPSIAANLLSIYQFTRDNNCYFVFYSDCFYVKDVKTGKTLFRGKSEHGLYPFRIHTQISTKSGRPFALVGVRVSVPIWHSRLGHPANNTLSHLISNKCLLMHDPPTQNPPNVPTTSITPTTNILITPPIITEPTQPNTTPIPNPIITETSPPTTNPHPMVTRSQAGISKPNPKYALNVTYDPTLLEPTCYTQAAKYEEWRKAMGVEFNALQQSGTWSLVPPTSDMNILPNKWVFKIKKRSDGTIERYKARLVANGYHQQEGIDYTETFSPVVKHSTIRIILALAVHHKWPIRQLDVQNAFLHGILSRGSTSSSHISSLIQNLGRLFSMKDLGPLHYFLGLEAVYSTTGLHLTQTKYTMDLLFRTKFQDVKPISSPATAGKKLSLYDGDPLSDPTEFRSVVGALQYLTLTRPDICFAVNQVCQFLHQPTTNHWTAVKRILRYLKDTPDHGLFYQPGSLMLEAYSDADYAGCPDDRHSTGGYCVYLGHNPISWSAKKQRTVSRSSTEAEYRQLAYTAAELSWIRSLFKDLGVCLSTPRIWCDNISSISLASNPVFHARTKHLEVDYHYVRDKVVRKELEVCYISTTDQVADIFTKGLSKSRFLLLTNKLMVRSRPISLRGCDNHGKSAFKSNSNTTTYDSQSDMISTENRTPAVPAVYPTMILS